MSALVIHAFERRKVERLVIQSDVANAASEAFARALGFESVGTATATYPDGAPRPVSRFEMSLESYRLCHGPTLGDRARRVRLVTDMES